KEKDTQTRQTNLFQNELSNLLDLDHELIPWAVLDSMAFVVLEFFYLNIYHSVV
ncbi:MAG: hypothetical protein HAW62_04415, partial [Endozoicomonadaceae bacterium]|nr:hypothetical protein [Endozoicomonadaceae bacterium]